MIDHLVEVLRTPLAFVLVLGVLVFIHEMGHYLAARLVGVHVDIFSIGFGPVLRRWHDRVGTEWRLCALPLGGYVKPHGFEEPDSGDAAADAQARAGWRPGQTFHDKPVWARAVVILAGPVFNFAFAVLLFAALYMMAGRPVSSTRVESVTADSAAAAAGIVPGDRLRSIGGVAVHDFDDIMAQIAPAPGRQTQVVLERDGHELSLPVTIGRAVSDGTPIGRLGIGGVIEPGPRLGPLAAVGAACGETWTVSVQTLRALWQMVTGYASPRALQGPLGIARLSGQVAKLGVASVLSFMALLSINLGLINLFPVPVLDGGRLVFYAVEAVRGRALPRAAREASLGLGMLLIGALFVFSTVNDLTNIGLFRWLAHTVG